MGKLGDYFNLIGGGTPATTKQEYWGEGVPWISSADIDYFGSIKHRRKVTPQGIENSTTSIVPAGTVIVVTRVGLGKVAQLTEDTCFSQDIQALVTKANTPAYDSRYLMYQLLFIMQSVKYNGRGTTISGITKKQLADISLYLPPLQEQEHIVTRIEELFSQLDAGMETLKKTKAQLAVYRQAVLKDAFEGRLTDHYTINVSLPWLENHNTVGLPKIPLEWRYIPLKELGDLGRGKSKHRPRNDPKLFDDGKYPFIQTGEVKAATKTITSHTKKYGDFGLQQSKLWPKGTLCITIAANIAETAFLGIDACFPDSVVGFTPNGTVLPEYIRYFIESQKRRLWAFAPATAQKNINLDTLENLIVPYCNVQEQQAVLSEIESRLSVCDSIEQTVDTTLQQAESMRQSILKQAFKGNL